MQYQMSNISRGVKTLRKNKIGTLEITTTKYRYFKNINGIISKVDIIKDKN